MHQFKQAIWGDIWKDTLGKSWTNATNATMHPSRQATWRYIWEHTLGKSQTNAASVTMHHIRQEIWGCIWKDTPRIFLIDMFYLWNNFLIKDFPWKKTCVGCNILLEIALFLVPVFALDRSYDLGQNQHTRKDSWAPTTGWGPNCPGPSCLGPNCPKPNCPGAQLSGARLSGAQFA